MKSFFKYTLASLLALFLFSIICTIIFMVSLAGMVANEGMTTSNVMSNYALSSTIRVVQNGKHQ